jgi:hypothetical protein
MTSMTDPTPRGKSPYDCERDGLERAFKRDADGKHNHCENQADRGRRSFAVRFQSEPSTAFYMSGEIIRELRKASENKKFNIPTTKNDMRKAA